LQKAGGAKPGAPSRRQNFLKILFVIRFIIPKRRIKEISEKGWERTKKTPELVLL